MIAGHRLTWRKWLSAWHLGVAVLCLGCASHLSAAIQFDVFLGYDSYVPEASWFPIICEINNDGPGFTADVEVSGGSFNEGTTRHYPLELPSGTTKRITIPVFFAGGYASGWNVRLLDEKHRVRAEQLNLRDRRQIKQESVMMGSLSRNGAWSPPFQKLKVKQQELAPASARFLPPVFPDNPIVLSGLDALYLNSEKTVDLRPEQQSAIQRWVESGGHLIVGVENISDVNANRWLHSLVPARLTGVQTVQAHPELQTWVRSPLTYDGGLVSGSMANAGPSQPSPNRPFADLEDDPSFEAADMQVIASEPVNAQVLVASEGKPLVIQASHGLGKITVLMFSPEREPFRSWKNEPAFWSRLTGVPARWYVSTDQQNYGGYSADGIFGAIIDSRQIRKLPVGWLLLLLAAYLVVIGPFDRWWLKKIGRPMLTWITFPLYVAMFSGLIYLIGYKLRAGEREWNELHVVDVIPAGTQVDFRGRTYGSLYSPVNDTYALRGPQKLAAFRGEAPSTWGGGGRSESIEVTQLEQSFEAEAYVPVWTSQLFVNDWWSRGTSPVEASLTESSGGLVCQLKSHAQQALNPLRLVWRGKVFELGSLGAGESRTVTLNLAQGRPLSEYVTSLGRNYQSAVQQRHRAFGSTEGGRINDAPGGVFVASFLSRVSNGRYLAAPGTDLAGSLSNSAVLLAWEPGEAAAAPLNQFRVKRDTVNTMWRIAVPLPRQP